MAATRGSRFRHRRDRALIHGRRSACVGAAPTVTSSSPSSSFPASHARCAAVRAGTFPAARPARRRPAPGRRVGARRRRRAPSSSSFREAAGGDVDITKAEFLLSVGRGDRGRGQHPAAFEQLAQRLGATLSVSRRWSTRGGCRAPARSVSPGKTRQAARVPRARDLRRGPAPRGDAQRRDDHRGQHRSGGADLRRRPLRGGRRHVRGRRRAGARGSDRLARAACRWSRASETRPVFWHFSAWLQGALVRARRRRRCSCSSTASRGRCCEVPPRAGRAVAAGPLARAAARRLAGGLRARVSHRTIARRDRDRRAGARGDLLRLPDAVRRHRDPRLRHRLHRPGVRLAATSTATSTSPTRRSSTCSAPRWSIGLLVMMAAPRVGVRRSSTTRVPTARPTSRSSTAASTVSATGCSSSCCSMIALHRLPARGRADRDGPPRLQRHPVRRLDRRAELERRRPRRRSARCATGCGGFTGCSRSRSSRASPRPRPAHMLTSYAQPVAARPARRQAAARRSRPSAPMSRPATARSPTSPAAPAPARRLHEVRALPRGMPGERDRPAAVAARRDPRAARAGHTRRSPASAACSAQLLGGSTRHGRAPVIGGDGVRVETVVVVHAVQRLRRDLPGRDRAGADHQPAAPPAGGGGRARPGLQCDAAGDPQVGQLVRREPPQARPLDRASSTSRSRTPARSRSRCCGSSATTPRSTRARSG